MKQNYRHQYVTRRRKYYAATVNLILNCLSNTKDNKIYSRHIIIKSLILDKPRIKRGYRNSIITILRAFQFFSFESIFSLGCFCLSTDLDLLNLIKSVSPNTMSNLIIKLVAQIMFKLQLNYFKIDFNHLQFFCILLPNYREELFFSYFSFLPGCTLDALVEANILVYKSNSVLN